MSSICFSNKIINIAIIFTIASINIVFSSNDYDMPSITGISTDLPYHKYYQKDTAKNNQVKLHPKDYFLSLYNPYYYRIPKSNQLDSSPDAAYRYYSLGFDGEMVNDYVSYGKLVSESGVNNMRNTLFNKDEDYLDINIASYRLQAWKNMLKTYGYSVDMDFVNTMRKKYNSFSDSNSDVKVQTTGWGTYNDDDFENNTISPFSKEEYATILDIMYLLPEKDESPEDYSSRHNNLVEINPDADKKMINIDIGQISDENLKKLKSSTIMQDESYSLYMIRMINMDVIPLHLKLCQKEYGAFKNWNVSNFNDDIWKQIQA